MALLADAPPHVRIEGSLKKASATYVSGLVEALANSLEKAIIAVKQRRIEELDVTIIGLENQLVNEVALSSSWKVHSSWTFKKQSHINILEEASILVDSFVVRGVTSKGRSSSRALSAILRRVGATAVAAAIYLTLPFVPARWNPSDDPTRDNKGYRDPSCLRLSRR